MAEVKDYFTGAVTLDRQEFENSFASSIHLHDDTACGRATLLQCIDTTHWPSPMQNTLKQYIKATFYLKGFPSVLEAKYPLPT